MRKPTLIILAAALAGAACADAAPPRTKRRPSMAHVELRVAAELADVSGTAVAFSPDGRVWAAADGQRLHVGAGHALVGTASPDAQSPIGPLSFSADGKQIHWGTATVGVDASGHAGAFAAPRKDVIDALTATLPSGGGSEMSASVCDGKVALVAGRSRQPMRIGAPGVPAVGVLLAIASGTAKPIWKGRSEEAPSVLALRGSLVAAGGSRLLLIDLASARTLLDDGSPHGAGSVNAIVFGSDTLIFTAGADGTVAEWELPSGRKLRTTKVSEDSIRAIAVDDKRSLLAVTGWDDTLRVYDLADRKAPVLSLALGAHGEAVAFAADGTLLVSLGGARGSLRWVELVRR